MNMKLFLVRVGRKTRGGNFQELTTRSVSVPEVAKIQDLYKYFCPRYKGFDVIIEQPECEELPGMPVEARDIPPNGLPEKRRGSLAFRIKYNDQEAALFKEYREHMDIAGDKKRMIENSIRERYGRLPYTVIHNWYDMELSTDTDGTYCNKLPIKSRDFFRVIKDCDDGTAELEITPKTESSSTLNDSDIPY